MNKKKLCWVTGDYFVDCDLKLEFLRFLSATYDIHWIVVFPLRGRRYQEKEFDVVKPIINRIDFFYLEHRQRDIRTFGDMRRLRKMIMGDTPDIIYLNIGVGDPYFVTLAYQLPAKRTIITAHQGRVHEGMNRKAFTTMIRNLVYSRLRYVNMFSESQMVLFKETYPKSTVFLNHLGLKEFGLPSLQRGLDETKVRFLSFGIINYAKNIELLIDAAEELYESGERGFVVSINGGCNKWDFYESRIKHPELFETDIRIVPNELIPNMFTRAHFFVQPYRVVSQSGPLKIAYSYNTPVIVSDLPGFTDEVVDGVTGFVFERDNKASLVATMKKAIACYRNGYASMLDSMKEYVLDHYSEKAMADNYLKMFNTVIKNGNKNKRNNR